jgi:penicillin-insensitive murein DD-endopeptidase
MQLARSILPALAFTALLAPSAEQYRARAAESDAPAHSWQGPATAAAEAAANQAAKETIVPPLPQPAARPADASVDNPKAATAKAAEPAAEKETSPVKAKAAAPTEKQKTETKDAKAKEKSNKPVVTAKQLFGSVKSAAPLKARSIGWYAKGCLAGGEAIPIDGPGWQVMRLSRNRNWGHPDLVALLERLAKETTAAKEWPGLLVGDMSQPRGGPMISGHASHQVGLDADIWLTPMPDKTLSKREREDMSAVSMLKNAGEVNPAVFGEGQVKLIKRAASYSKVERILVHPAIKKALCEAAGKNDRTWLNKVRPYFGHFYHFHMRIGCPAGSANCQAQPPIPDGDSCGAELTGWLKRVAPKPKPKPPETAEKPQTKPSKPPAKKPEMTLADLPADCSTVITAGGNKLSTVPTKIVDNSKDAGPEKDLTASTAAPAPPKVEKVKDASATKKATN